MTAKRRAAPGSIGGGLMSPSLGWLQAFLCAADHLDYQLAANELGMSANRVLQRVEKLERWLHKILIFDDPIELNDADSAEFIAVAWEVLNRFAATCQGDNFSIAGLDGLPRTRLIAKVRLYDLERFLALAGEGTIKGAADVARCDVGTVYRTVRDLEKVTGSQLVRGRVSVHLTDAGELFRDAAAYIVKSLNDFRAIVPDDYDPSIAKAQNLIDILERRKVKLRFILGLINESERKQRGRVRPEDIHKALGELDHWIARIQRAMNEGDCSSDEGADLSTQALPSNGKAPD